MALTSTTLSLACTATDTLLTLVSTSGVVTGTLLGIESEILTVAGLTGVGTQVRVLRGVNGTSSVSHAAAVTVSIGTPQDFATASQNIVIAPSGSVLMGQGPGAPPAYSTVGGTLSLTDLTVSGTVGIGTTSPDAKLDVVNSALAATSTDGIVLQNETASTAGATVQMSPRLTLKGHAWNSTGSADETESFFIENLPATTAGTITGTMKVGFINNAGTVTYPSYLTSDGFLYVQNTGLIGFQNRSRFTSPTNGQINLAEAAGSPGVGLDVTTDATLKIRTRAQTGDASLTALDATLTGVLTAGGVGTGTVATFYTGTSANSNTLKIANGAGSASSTIVTRNGNSGLNIPLNIVSSYLQLISDTSGVIGVGLDVTTDATLKIRTRAQTADAQLSAASVRGNAVAFASVPGTPVEGMLVAVTDSSTAIWGATITGGGANHVLGFFNGSAWTVAGK